MKALHIFTLILLFAQVAQADESIRKITVTGLSTSIVAAHYSKIHTKVKYVGKTIEESHTSLIQTLTSIIRSMKELGLQDDEITKSIVTQGAEYNWQNNSRVHIGYYSTCSLELKVNDLSSLHRIYNELSKHSALSIGGTTYGRNDKPELQNTELQKALLIARTKAETMAATFDIKLGRVLRMEEAGAGPAPLRPEVMYASRANDSTGGGTFGSVTITGSVRVEFELK